MDSVALVRHKGSIQGTLREGIDLIGGFEGLKSPVIIKPNICTIMDGTGYSVTNVEVIEAVIHLLLAVNDSLVVRIVESDSQSKYAEEAFKKFGYKQLVEGLQHDGFDAGLVDLSRSSLASLKFRGRYFEGPELPEEIVGPHYFVSVAAAKTHYLTTVTGVLKNQFGVLPRKDQAFYHSRISDVIIDLNRLIQPDLCIVDARVGVEGWNGPKTRELNSFIIGKKAASVDATMARIMGFDPADIDHIAESSSIGLGSLNPDVLGESIESVAVKFSSPH